MHDKTIKAFHLPQTFQVPEDLKEGMIINQNKSQFIIQNVHNSPKYIPKEKRIHKAEEDTIKDVKLDPAMKDLSYSWMGAVYSF